MNCHILIDIRAALMTGIDIPIPECQLTLHQPSAKEISMIGEQSFFTGLQCLTINKHMYIQDESLLERTSNFEIFMKVMTDKEAKDKKKDTVSTLKLLFPSYKVIFTPRSLSFNLDGETIIIDEDNFEILQQVCSEAFCLKSAGKESFNPGNAEAKKIADKLMRARQRVAAQKNESNASIFSQYLSIISVGLKLSVREVAEYTMYQIYDTIERYELYINYDLDIKSRLAGGKPDSKPDHWMKIIH